MLANHRVTVMVNKGAETLTFALFNFSREGLSVQRTNGEDLGSLLKAPNIIIDNIDYGTVNLSCQGEYRTIDKKTIAYFKVTDRAGRSLLWKLLYKYKYNSQQQLDAYSESQVNETRKYKMPPGRGVYTEQARQKRLTFVREHGHSDLMNVGETSIDPRSLASNIESFIGAVQIPVGVAGPLLIDGCHAQGTFYAPIATSEGALVASITRGAYAISLAGGVKTRVFNQRMIRTPSFTFENISQSHFFACWVNEHFKELRDEVEKYSNYAKLVELEADVFGRVVYVNFVYNTGDASGQNMTTTCTWEACKLILKEMEAFLEINIKRFLVESGPSSDKKVSAMSLIKGRGIKVQAEVTIPAKVIRRVLKCNPQEFKQCWDQLTEAFSRSGGVGCSINVANVIAGIFTATGQDIACVHESSIANSSVDVLDNGDLYYCMSLPSLVIGTVGGGTGLAHQRECLEMIDCYGDDKVMKFAEIIAGFCLALDLSTGAAIVTGDFATAHEALGRNRSEKPIKIGDLNERFFQNYLRKSEQNSSIVVNSVRADRDFELEGSIVTELTSRKIVRSIGLYPYEIDYQARGKDHNVELMVKIKPTAQEVASAGRQLAAMCGPDLEHAFGAGASLMGLDKCDIREIGIYSQTDELFLRNVPKFYGALEEASQNNYVLVLERLTNMDLMDSADNVSAWTSTHIKSALNGIAECHSIWFQKEAALRQCDWLGETPSTNNRVKLKKLYQLLGDHAHQEFPGLFTAQNLERLQLYLDNLESWWQDVDSMPKTLIHNDFNPRNMAFRQDSICPQVCIYDWELSTLHIPQFDIAELLIYTLQGDFDIKKVKSYVEYYRNILCGIVDTKIDENQFWHGFKLAVQDFYISKIPVYLMTHTFREYGFMERVVHTVTRLLEILEAPVALENFNSTENNECTEKSEM